MISNYAAKLDEKREYDRKRTQTPGRRARATVASRKHREANPEKYKARTAVNNAVRDGRLKRQPCEGCGAESASGHHEDYSKPLDVRWLCVRCHFSEHGTLVG